MESSNKTWNDREKKKMVIKFGGGGIGAVVLLGGALATAALASAFVVGIKGRSSTKDRRRCHQNPPPENSTQSGEDEANKEQEIISTDHQPSHVFEHPSEGAKEKVESENDSTAALLVSTRSSTMDEEDKIEINGGTPGDVEVSYPSLCSISPKKLKNDTVSNDEFIIVDEVSPLLEEKSPLDSQNKMPEDEETKVELPKEDVCNDCLKENTNLEQVEGAEIEKNGDDDGAIEVMSCKEGVEEERDVESVQIDRIVGEERKNTEPSMEREEVEGLCIGDGEISEEKKCVEDIERATMDSNEDGSNQENLKIVDSEDCSGEEEEVVKALLPEFESDVINRGDEKESAFPSETVEIVQDDGATEESREDEAKYVEEKLVEEEEKCDQLSDLIEGIVPEKCEGVESKDGANQSHQVTDLIEEREENIVIPYENNEEKVLQMVEELIHEVAKEDAANEGVADSQEVYENKISTQFDAGKNDEKEIEEVHEKNTEKEVEEEVIYLDNIEATKDEIINVESDESMEESENISDEEEEEEDGLITTESSEVEEEEEWGADKIEYSNDEIVEETSDSSTESNSEAVWPAESPNAKLVNYEVEGKIQEDKTVKEDEDENGENFITSERTYIKKRMVEMARMVKSYPANPTKRRMVIGTLSLLSSLSCSWFFGLSFVKLCLVLFLTMVVSEIHGY